MPAKALEFHVKKERGRLVVQAMGRTGRGTKFIVDERTIAAPTVASKEFKEDVAKAISELDDSERSSTE